MKEPITFLLKNRFDKVYRKERWWNWYVRYCL